MPKEGGKILHVDCDCFFAAVEMRDRPDLQDIPIAIGGSSDRRGVISTCNYPARAYGVRSAMATAQAMKLCPNLVLLSGNMNVYRQVSKQIMAILQGYAESFQAVSIDEAYLKLPADDNAYLIAELIKQQVKQLTGITVSIGIADNKFLAKIASDWQKPDGLFEVKTDEKSEFVANLPLGLIPGIGKKTSEKLQKQGLRYCRDVLPMPLNDLVSRYGKLGVVLYKRSRGIGSTDLDTSRVRKSISVERTFPEDLTDPSDMLAAVDMLWQRLTSRAEQADIDVSQLAPFVKVKFSDFQQTTLSNHEFKVSQESYQQLILQARQRMSNPVRLLGIGGRCPELNSEQLSLEL